MARDGMIDDFTSWLIHQVCRQVVVWKQADLQPVVSVNLDPHSLTDLELPDRFQDIVRQYGIGCEAITFELTETARIADNKDALDILMRLRLKGFDLSLDDFGTGYSTLVELYRMPFSELKVDRSFVVDLAKSEEARIIVKSVIDLAHNMGLRACAEGVEDQAALTFLTDIGCDRAQGYHFSEPLPLPRVRLPVRERDLRRQRLERPRRLVTYQTAACGG